MTTAPYVSPDHIRERFAASMSSMYQAEVPQYATLVALVEQVNRETLERDSGMAQRLAASGELTRLNVERHGAIRVGTAGELAQLRRLFAVMGMHPVGYYDLSVAGVPVHSTVFRPIDEAALAHNPFRIFTSLLRLELIEDLGLRERAIAILARRDIFTPGVRELIGVCEQQGGLTVEQTERFVAEALETFRWHRHATVDWAIYKALHDVHRLIADVVCFKGPHINHLTPRTLDIDEVQRRMPVLGITPKAVIEGPPRRRFPILLRQTSFAALEEPIIFTDDRPGTHSARFGEIEQRGMALTAGGRALYDRLLTEARKQSPGYDNKVHQRVLESVFADFPDNDTELRRRELAFFDYQTTGEDAAVDAVEMGDIERLIEAGVVRAVPITYEDFLPVSAAGIFQSNLGGTQTVVYEGNEQRKKFEDALGAPVIDELSLYAQQEAASKRRVLGGGD